MSTKLSDCKMGSANVTVIGFGAASNIDRGYDNVKLYEPRCEICEKEGKEYRVKITKLGAHSVYGRNLEQLITNNSEWPIIVCECTNGHSWRISDQN